MKKIISRLYPADAEHEVGLKGLYLRKDLHTSHDPARPYVYTNFVSSLDGRIAIANQGRGTYGVPASIENKHDWRLYQELAGRADLIITSGRFIRQTLAGKEQAVLPISLESEYEDILAWRKQQGLGVQPDIAILSASLDIPVAALKNYRGRKVIVVTGNRADKNKTEELQEAGIEVLRAGKSHHADGKEMITSLGSRGYQSIYAVAGPSVCNTLVAAQVLDRLYLTITHQLLSGNEFDTVLTGNSLSPAQGMQLVSLYMDTHAPEGASQWFCAFEPH
jgi:riboflavin biosynthesis pyrimidine reductase